MKKYCCSVLLFLTVGLGFAFTQNLVINGGFEQRLVLKNRLTRPSFPCSFASDADVFNHNVAAWETFLLLTPDILYRDTLQPCPWLPVPRRGKRMVGMIMYHPFYDGFFAADYHEFIAGKLRKPLEAGKQYRINVWVYYQDSLGAKHLQSVYGKDTDVRPVRCGNFGFCFLTAPINRWEDIMKSQVEFPLKPQLNREAIVGKSGEWEALWFDFTPDRPYTHLLFGNFFSDAVTDISMTREDREQLDIENARPTRHFLQKTKRIAYYCFDDFSIEEMDAAWLERNLLATKSYTLQASVLFDTDQWILKQTAMPEITRLATVLQRNQAIRIEIGGHTDAVGDAAYNLTLSEKRALAVFEALVQLGVPAEQLSRRGYGEMMPVADNSAEAGRQLNRRVECKVQ